MDRVMRFASLFRKTGGEPCIHIWLIGFVAMEDAVVVKACIALEVFVHLLQIGGINSSMFGNESTSPLCMM
jgi:hypothetical protein